MLDDLSSALAAAKSNAAAAPQNATLASNVAYLETWFATALLSQPPQPHSRPALHDSWLQAVKQGDVSLQRWLSATSRLTPPRIRIDTPESAKALIDFRASVGRLDQRCDAQAEKCGDG